MQFGHHTVPYSMHPLDVNIVKWEDIVHADKEAEEISRQGQEVFSIAVTILSNLIRTFLKQNPNENPQSVEMKLRDIGSWTHFIAEKVVLPDGFELLDIATQKPTLYKATFVFAKSTEPRFLNQLYRHSKSTQENFEKLKDAGFVHIKATK